MTTPRSNPEETARAVLKRLDGKDWAGAAALHSTAFLMAFVGLMRTAFEHAEPLRLTPEDLMEGDPEMPRTVATYLANRPPGVLPADAGVDGFESVDELDALSPAEVYARRLKVNDPREFYLSFARLAAEDEGGEVSTDDLETAESWNPWRGRIVGHLVEGDRAFVLWWPSNDLTERDHGGGVPLIIPMVQQERAWRVDGTMEYGNRVASGGRALVYSNGLQALLPVR